MAEDFTVFTGTANPNLATAVAHELGVRPGSRNIEKFPDGEISIRLDESVRKREVFIVQPTSPPVNDHLIELLAFADACPRAAPAESTLARRRRSKEPSDSLICSTPMAEARVPVDWARVVSRVCPPGPCRVSM